MRKLQNRPEKGFTIIELLIVLAIAALIILIVLIAVPQLQRNQRNAARQSIAGRIATEINNFAGNNNGNLPTTGETGQAAFKDGFNTRYFSGVDVTDPRRDINIVEEATTNSSGVPGDEPGDLNYTTSMLCNGEFASSTVDGVTATTRNFALVMRLEGGATYCLDNS